MLSDFTIGQFFPGNSVLHRLDPRMKLALTFAYIVVIFVPQNWFGLALAAVFIAACVLVSRLPLSLVLRSMKPVLPLILLTAVINLFYAQGEPLWQWWVLRITAEGISNAIFIAVRILCLIVGTSLLTYTTSPTALTDGLERLLAPLKVLRVPVHEIAMMMTIALRFIPTLIEETDKIMSAQKARGADLESGGLLQRVRALIPILIPLFVSSFRRAYELATAMECRCYHGGEGRTRMKQFRLQPRDFICLAVMLVFTVGLILLNVWVTPVI